MSISRRRVTGLSMLVLAAFIGFALHQTLTFVGVAAGRRTTGLARRAVPGIATTAKEAEELEVREQKKRDTLERISKVAKEGGDDTIIAKEVLGKFWVNQPGQISFEIEFNRGDTVKDLRTVIEKVTGIPAQYQEVRMNSRMVSIDYDDKQLEGIDLSDVWLEDERDYSERRGEYNPDPEEDMDVLANPLKIGIYTFSFVITLFWVTQMMGVNPYANFPEGPRADWSKVPEDLRPGGDPIQNGGSLIANNQAIKKVEPIFK